MVFRAGLAASVTLVAIARFDGRAATTDADSPLAWPEVRSESKPWTRFWWMGSAVNRADLTRTLEAYARAGLGGIEITPIYGARGAEEAFIPFLSEPWMDTLEWTLEECRRLGMGVDMATGTGWPFGGPWVEDSQSSKYVTHVTYPLLEGQRLTQPIALAQAPLLRQIGQPRVRIDELNDPIAATPGLQGLAIDQVRFPKPMTLQALMAYSDHGRVLNLTSKVNDQVLLDWTAPSGAWTLYAVFQGWHGKMVERAAPGGEGMVIDHFSTPAIRDYLARFDQAFTGRRLDGLRAFFNDSYEVDDARGEANWTPMFFREFKRRRGYDLRRHLPSLFEDDSGEIGARVLSDYRETLGDLLLDTFTKHWSHWSRRHRAQVRNQAHGSPANILDLYAASDIPETEGTDLLRIKFATSAAHVAGKPLASSESATWLGEHFTSTLADVKQAVDRFFLGGVNHVFFHGSNYSPAEEAWPGWLFYAAVHFNPRNPWWEDLTTLNGYIARVQSFLQDGQPGNDVLLYLPIHDLFSRRGRAMLEHVDGLERGWTGSDVKACAESMVRQGHSFDYISDRQIARLNAVDGRWKSGGAAYQTVLVPKCHSVPLETLKSLLAGARRGGTVIFHHQPPADVPGLARLESRRRTFRKLLDNLAFEDGPATGVRVARVGRGRVWVGESLEALLQSAQVARESMVDAGLQCVRRRHPNGYHYLIVNWDNQTVDSWIPLAVPASAVARFDPMTGRAGLARARVGSNQTLEVRLNLRPGESCLLRTFDRRYELPLYPEYRAAGEPIALKGMWTVQFLEGGPALPRGFETDRLASWTERSEDAAKAFSGTASYTMTFSRPPGSAEAWRLDLGQVCSSARVALNGRDLGTLVGPTFSLDFEDDLLQASNALEIKVTNLMANRIADLDRRGVVWRKFYNVNFPANRPENRGTNGLFSAVNWSPLPSGLLGPVQLTPLRPDPHPDAAR